MCKGNYIFNPGDVVKRKVTELDEGWCYAAHSAGKRATDTMVVATVEHLTITLVGVNDRYFNSAAFDLVCRASTTETTAPSLSTKASVVPTIAAHGILQNAAAEMLDRAASRDTPKGERSMGRCVKAFNAMFGTELTETQGWQFMELLKMARSVGGAFRLDDFTDGVAYAALAGESEARLKQSV